MKKYGTYEEIKACQWLINHYTELAKGSFEYHDLPDAYLMYNHYMVYVAKYKRKLDESLSF